MNRLLPLVKEYGFTVAPAYAMVNNVWTKRSDIVSLRYHGHHIMTAPLKMLREPKEGYKTYEGVDLPFFFEIEHKLRNWNLIIKNTPHIQKLDEKKMKLEVLNA